MKITASIVASLLVSVVVARPRAMEKGDPLPQKSRVTAFVIDDNGNPSVECWEFTNMVDSKQIQRADGSKATASALSLASSGELDGLDILTWPPYSPIWPPTDDTARSQWFDLANNFNLFTVQGGLINFNVKFRVDSNAAATADDDNELHIFSLENGDDWFYFEDSSSDSSFPRSANAAASPFTISTISGSETEVLRLKYSRRPQHRVVNKGGCTFTGIEVPNDSSNARARTSRVHSPLTVQVHIEDSL